LDDILSETTKDGKKDAVETYNREKDSLDLDSTQRENLFFSVINKYKNMVDDKLGNTLSAHYANSSEKVVLVSLVYNGGSKMIGPNLSAALIEGDRVKTWYEIRYNSNSQNHTEGTQRGIANRRIEESNLFGLYDDPENIDINEAKHTYRFLESKRNEIQNKITHIRNLKGNIDTIKLAKDDLDVQLKATRDLILNTFAKDKNINGSIIIGKDIGDPTDDFRDIGNDFNDEILRGTNKNDLIFGEKGSDTISGGRGNDVLYGGSDDRDDDAADTLKGGTGFDTYYVGDEDIIFDSDGKGKVFFDGVELKGGTYDKDKGAYVSKDGFMEYRLNESGGKSTLTVQKGGKSITINEFNKEDKSLGIKLANSKIEVSVTNKEGSANWLKESLGDTGLPFTLSLNRKLDKGEYLKIEVVSSIQGDKSIIEFKEGDISKDFNFTWEDDNYPQGNRSFVVNAYIVEESSDLTAEVVSSARGMIKDDDRNPDNPNNPNYPNNPDVPTDPNDPENAPMYYDPIIIDLNKDGTTTSKLNGAVNFDMDNNGFKEATGWISKDDAFLAYDKNGNGKIDNGSKLFGNHMVSNTAYGYTDGRAVNGYKIFNMFPFEAIIRNDNLDLIAV
jgi:type I secretion target ggxgxdxxx repeat domain protein